MINDIDISAVYGAYFKKGAYNTLMSYPSVKEYLTEEVREENGERTLIVMPRVKARTVTMDMYIVGGDKADAQIKSEQFLVFLLNSGEFLLHLVSRNRGYRLSFVGGEARRAITEKGRTYIEMSIQFKQDDPSNVIMLDYLAAESNEYVITEDGEQIAITDNIYK